MKRIEDSGIINKKPQHPKTIPKNEEREIEVLSVAISGIAESTLVELNLTDGLAIR